MVHGLMFVVFTWVLQMLQIHVNLQFIKFCISCKIPFHLSHLKMYGSPIYENHVRVAMPGKTGKTKGKSKLKEK